MKVIWLHDGLNQLYIDKHAVSYDCFICMLAGWKLMSYSNELWMNKEQNF